MSRPSDLDPDPTTARGAVDVAVAQWRAAHPDATLAEIERAVDQHLSTYRAALITTTAAAPEPDVRPVCPACGTPMQRVGPRTRRRRTTQDGELRFTEAAWRCPACGAGRFPPD